MSSQLPGNFSASEVTSWAILLSTILIFGIFGSRGGIIKISSAEWSESSFN